MRQQAPLSSEVSACYQEPPEAAAWFIVRINAEKAKPKKQSQRKDSILTHYFGTEKKTCLAQDIGTSFAACCLHDQGTTRC